MASSKDFIPSYFGGAINQDSLSESIAVNSGIALSSIGKCDNWSAVGTDKGRCSSSSGAASGMSSVSMAKRGSSPNKHSGSTITSPRKDSGAKKSPVKASPIVDKKALAKVTKKTPPARASRSRRAPVRFGIDEHVEGLSLYKLVDVPGNTAGHQKVKMFCDPNPTITKAAPRRQVAKEERLARNKAGRKKGAAACADACSRDVNNLLPAWWTPEMDQAWVEEREARKIYGAEQGGAEVEVDIYARYDCMTELQGKT